MTTQLKLLTTSRDIAPYLELCAALRITEFRDYPYLYAGSFAYERAYLGSYLGHPHACLVLILDHGQIVGLATGIPFTELASYFGDAAAQYAARGHSAERLYYFGETIIRQGYRRKGLGRMAYLAREEHAREHGYAAVCLATVDRSSEHPQRPPNYQLPDGFWHKLCYRDSGIRISNEYPAVQADGSVADSQHCMRFWTKEL